ncbi:hypothetical protein V9T40_008828 [Parthenolecanium corni]|uniref:Uncharacterized protein n=1 Tax=Parthenolecanium corni TaxID=536013 RepID=A0AAN9TMH0_9HEMI
MVEFWINQVQRANEELSNVGKNLVLYLNRINRLKTRLEDKVGFRVPAFPQGVDQQILRTFSNRATSTENLNQVEDEIIVIEEPLVVDVIDLTNEVEGITCHFVDNETKFLVSAVLDTVLIEKLETIKHIVSEVISEWGIDGKFAAAYRQLLVHHEIKASEKGNCLIEDIPILQVTSVPKQHDLQYDEREEFLMIDNCLKNYK